MVNNQKAMSLFKTIQAILIILSLIFVQTAIITPIASAEFVTEFRVTATSDQENYDINDTVIVSMQAENHTDNEVTLNFSTGCQMGIEVFLNDELVYSDDMHPRNCSDAFTKINLPKDKKAVWSRSFQSTDEGYPFTENGRYKIHAFILDHEDEEWYSQTTSFVNVVFGEEYLYVFNDIYGHWALTYIQKLFDQRIVKGYEDGGFHPDSNINRAELVQMSLDAAGIEKSETQDDENFKFEDLDDWQVPCVYDAWKRGIVQGYNETTFAPAQDVTRAEALKIALLAFGADIPDTSDEWAFDDTQDHWGSSYINFAYLHFIVSGRADGDFYPNDPITRAEAAKIISKLIEL